MIWYSNLAKLKYMDFLRTVLLWTNKSFDPIVGKTLIMYHVISSGLFFVEIFMMMEYRNQGIVNYMGFFLKKMIYGEIGCFT